MSRQELADAVNAYLAGHQDERYRSEATLDAKHIGKLERGEHRWPNDLRREAFRSALGAATDAELGFYIMRGLHLDSDSSGGDGSRDDEPTLAMPSGASNGGKPRILEDAGVLNLRSSGRISQPAQDVGEPSSPGAVLAEVLHRLDAFAWSGPQTMPPTREREVAYERLVEYLVHWGHTVQRREVLRMLGWAATAASAAPGLGAIDSDDAERISYAIQAPSRIDHRIIDHIDKVLWNSMRQDDTLGPQSALDTVLAQRNLVRVMLKECPREIRSRLLSTFSNISGYAGWLAFDLNDFESASYYYEEARTAAHEAHDTELGALILCNMSHLATWRGRPRVGIDHAVAAQIWAARTDDPALRAYASDVAARAFALDGQGSECGRELELAQARLSERAEPSDRSPMSLMYFYDEGLLAHTKGLCLLSLGHSSQAISHIESALSLFDSSFVRNRAMTTVYLCTANLRAGRVDHAARAAGQAAELATHNRSARATEMLREARMALRPWSDSVAVRELDDKLHHFGIC